MLVEQGVRSVELWTGRPGPVEAMREAARAALDRTEVRA
jgi:shikimate 5-dehydrogenase